MALARVKVWIPGDVLTAADLNGEFNNVINNPITLISPSTGAINFNLQAHTNLVPAAITASSASAGQALISTGGLTPIWGTPSVVAANLTGFTSGDTPVGTSSGALSAVAIGSTGKVYAVTSSNSSPAWQVIPIDGGLSTATPTIGMVYVISSSAGYLRGITVGTSGQIFMVTTSGMPGWQNLTTGGGASGAGTFSSQFTLQEDWSVITSGSGTNLSTSITSNNSGLLNYAVTSSGNSAVSITQLTAPNGLARFVVSAAAGSFALSQASTIGALLTPFQTSLNPQLTMVCYTSISTGTRMGLSTAGALGSDPTNGLYFRTSALGSTWTAVTRVGGLEFTVTTTAVSSTTPQTFQIVVSASGTIGTVITNGVTAGTFSSSQIPSATNFTYGVGTSLACNMVMDAWQLIQDRSSAST